MQFVTEAQNKKTTPSIIVKGRHCFKWEWKYDPTILSMLVVMNAIFNEMGDDWQMDMNVCR
jgi:hypothetical protein